MNVFLQYEMNETGKGLFLARLEPELKKLDVYLKTSPKGCDLTLSLTSWRKESGKLPRVLRLDGVHMVQGKRIGWRNDQISKGIKKSDVAIWQSRFCKRIVGGMLGKPKKNFVIFNGMNPDEFSQVDPIRSPYPRNIMMLAKWDYKDKTPRKHKRLKEAAKIARDYTAIDPQACFWIVGNTKERRYESERIRYTGWLEIEETKRYMKMCDVGVYPAWFDWCPNSVVESISAGQYMIVSNNGGQAELVEEYGKVVDVDKPMTPQALKRMHVPEIDRSKFVNAIAEFYFVKPQRSFNPALHISRIARKYKEAFEAAL